MGLFDLGLGAEEQPCLAVVIGEAFSAQPDLFALDWNRRGAETALGIFTRAAVLARLGQAVGLIVGAALWHSHLHMPVALEVLEGAALGLIDRDLVEVDRAQARQLGVLIGEQPPLQQRIFRKVDARHDVGRQEGDLFGFGEEVVRVAVQNHAADHADRIFFFRHQLGGVQNVEGQGVGLVLGEQLHAELPFGEVALIDGLIQVAAVIIGVGAGDLYRLVPAGGLRAQLGPPVELDQSRLAFGIDQPEGVDAETFHHA